MLVFLFCFLFLGKQTSDFSKSIVRQRQNQNSSDSTQEVIPVYEKVYDFYYQKTIERLKNENQDIPSLKQFIDCFESQKESIDSFSESYGRQNAFSLCSSSEDATYLLGSQIGTENYTSSRYFQRKPILNSFSYSCLEDGDIIYESENSGIFHHVAFLYSSRHNSDYGYYPQTIEAVPGGVQFGFLDDERIVRYKVFIYRVARAKEYSSVTRAKEFIRVQVGKQYAGDDFSSFSKTDTSIDEKEWYCSELVFAAYWAGGMNIGSTSNRMFDPTAEPILPSTITKAMMVYQVVTDEQCLNIRCHGFSSGQWNISVYNPNFDSVLLEYNEKMCFENDAKNWTGLNDIKTIVLNSHSSESVMIKENWFATTVAFSYQKDGKRYITYAYDLNKDTYKMNVTYCKK